MAFDPFSRHRSNTESQPDQPDHKIAEAPAIETCPPTKPVKAARTSKRFDPFNCHADEKRSSIERRLRRALKVEPAQALLDWLQQDQTRTFISARDICRGGPMQTRKLECVIDAARILVEAGWLIPVKTRRHDMRWWQIVRKPILAPIVATIPSATVAAAP
jgi:hypothetical protein